MLQKNVYKPRYKLAFQAKSKIWPYKNSRLRRFFNIRGRKILRRGFFKRIVMVFNNMKWTIARRYIRPEMRRRNARKRRYRDSFYNKQQLRLFYGKIKETRFRSFYKKYLINSVNRNRSFFASLERRIDTIFFRSRLLPTIFACNQYIHHYGLRVNNKLEYSPHILLNPGDIISISKTHWRPLFWTVHYRIFNRVYGKEISIKRKYTLLKKKTRWVRKKILDISWLFFLYKRFYDVYALLLKSQKYFLFYFDLIFYKVYNLYNNLKWKLNNDNLFSQINMNFKHLINRMESLFLMYQSIFNTYIKYVEIINNLYENIKTTFHFKRKKKKYLKWQNPKFKDAGKSKSISDAFLKTKNIDLRHLRPLKQRRIKSKVNSFNILLQEFNLTDTVSKKKKKVKAMLQKILSLIPQIEKKVILTKKEIKKSDNLKNLETPLKIANKEVFIRTNKKILEWKFGRYSERLLKKNKIHFYNKIPILTLNLYKEIFMLFIFLKLEELQYYNILLSSFKENNLLQEITNKKVDWNSFLKTYIEQETNVIVSKSIVLRKKISRYFSLFLRKTFIKQKLRSSIKYNLKLKRFIPRPNHLSYFLLNKKYKKSRRLKIFRLKPVHWALPKYIHFDFRTLRTVFLYSPSPNEIHYSFKCSLTKITSFYKSLAL